MHRIPCFLALAAALCASSALAQTPPAFLGMWGTYGTGPGQFDTPQAIAVDPSGMVWVADFGRVQAFTPEGGFVSQWATGAGNASGIAVDGLGHVFLMAYLTSSTVVLRTFDTNGVPLANQYFNSGGGCECVNHMGGVAVTSGGQLLWVRWGAITIIGLPREPYGGVCSSSGCWGVPGTGPGQFDAPYGIAASPAGFVYVTDQNQRRVQKHALDGTFVTQWGSSGSGPGQFTFPTGVAVAPNGDVYVADVSRISQFTSGGTYLTSWGTLGSDPGQFNVPFGVAVSGSGDVYVADTSNHRVQRFGNAPVANDRSSWGRLKSIYR